MKPSHLPCHVDLSSYDYCIASECDSFTDAIEQQL